MDVEEELGLLVDALAEASVSYALCGAMALAVHGIPRATLDIDLLVPPEEVGAVEEVARARGFVVAAPSMQLAEGRVRIHRLSKVDPSSGDVLSLDALVVTPSLEPAWAGRQRVSWGGRELPVVSPEGLIFLKQLRGSGQDADDVARLRALLGDSPR